jgi:TPR repeat protein
MAHNGKTPKEERAADWFEKAARAGDPQGQFFYAVALAEGDSRPKNPGEALMWLDRSLAEGVSLPDELRRGALDLRRRLTSASPAAPALRN